MANEKAKKAVKKELIVKRETNTLSVTEMQKLLKLRKSIFQMCHDRGYKVSDFDLNEDFDEFYEYFQDKQFPSDEFNVLLNHVWDVKDHIYITFQYYNTTYESKVLDDIDEFVGRLTEESIHKAIVVVETNVKIGTATLTKINNYAATFALEIFTDGELLLNPMKHILNPKYTPLNLEETQQVLLDEKVKLYQLPRIRLTDPVARYFGLKRGEVLRIEEKNERGAYNTAHKVVL